MDGEGAWDPYDAIPFGDAIRFEEEQVARDNDLGEGDNQEDWTPAASGQEVKMLLKDMNLDQLAAMLTNPEASRRQARYASTKISAGRWAKAGQKGIALAMSNAAQEQLANMDPQERVWAHAGKTNDQLHS